MNKSNLGILALLMVAGLLGTRAGAEPVKLIAKHYVSAKGGEVVDGHVYRKGELMELPETYADLNTRLSPESHSKHNSQTTPRRGPEFSDPNLIVRGAAAIKVDDGDCQHRLTVGSDALFDFDRSDLTASAEETLRALGPMILKVGSHPVSIEGHTDSIGADEYNMDLGRRRAESVKLWLLNHDFLTDSAQIVSYGESRPVSPNTFTDGSDFAAGRQKNRRVEIIIDTCR